MINKVNLIGNLGGDPEIKNLDNGSKVARFSLATNENYQDKSGEWQTKTEWHNVVAWRNLADRVESQLKKGMLVYVDAKISYRKWQDSEGKDRYSTDIVANTFRLLEKREGSAGPSSRFPSAENEPTSSFTAGKEAKPLETNTNIQNTPMEDDDLPF